ncbi:unnamed protein product [Spirodela intermedia]|uniref:Cytochrome b561 and DOMON domain-containing protein n=1 Tax=Spirodela intermedia TaxID=51605 RepID=A0A7I8KS46_SPIIN|nr:unnamed protein product [Spirodela intermedia]
MARRLKMFSLFPLLIVVLLLKGVTVGRAQSGCAARTFAGNRKYGLCSELPRLGSTLHYTHDTGSSLLRLAFSATPSASGGWISWGINPNDLKMIGTQALLAFRTSNGSIDVDTYNISSYKVRKSKIDYEVSDLEAEYGSDGVMTIFATMKLPAGTTKVNQVWQVGPSVQDGNPMRHSFDPANLAARATLDLAAGGVSSDGTTSSRLRRANIHGVLNAVGWGVLIPTGAIIARYLRTVKSADPAWFYLHVACQLSGYSLGVAGWATGLKLGKDSEGVQHTTHRNLGIALFCVATLQVFALFVRPSKEHKFRLYWAAYHHLTGYVVIVLGIVNIFRGFSILKPADRWKTTYIAVIAALGGIAVLLELVTWAIYLRRRQGKKTASNTEKLPTN